MDDFDLVRQLSWPENRELLIRIALTCPQTRARADAIGLLRWPEDRETIEAVARLPLDEAVGGAHNRLAVRVARLRMAKAGVCPECGGPIRNYRDTVYRGDDPNDVSREVEVYVCRKCDFSIAE